MAQTSHDTAEGASSRRLSPSSSSSRDCEEGGDSSSTTCLTGGSARNRVAFSARPLPSDALEGGGLAGAAGGGDGVEGEVPSSAASSASTESSTPICCDRPSAPLSSPLPHWICAGRDGLPDNEAARLMNSGNHPNRRLDTWEISEVPAVPDHRVGCISFVFFWQASMESDLLLLLFWCWRRVFVWEPTSLLLLPDSRTLCQVFWTRPRRRET